MARDTSLCSKDTCYSSLARKILKTKRDIPRINGSSGAFIAVIVCLVFIIIATWAAIFLLLRDKRALDVEEARHSNQDQPLTTPHFSTTTARPTWGSRIMAFFGRAGQKINVHSKKRGWVQAGDADNCTGVNVSGSSGVREVAGPLSLQHARSTPSLISRSTSGSLSTVHLDPHGIRSLSSSQIAPTHSILPSTESQPSSPSISPQSSNTHFRSLSPELNTVRFSKGGRDYIGSSGMIMRTLQGGTKFVEEL